MKAVIFDLDGVICFTDRYHYKAWKEIADEIGVPFDEVTNNRMRGVSRMASLEILLEGAGRSFSPSEKEALAERKNGIYVALLDEMGPSDLSEEVRDTLGELRKKGLLLAIGSSSRNTKKILEKLGLQRFFDAVSDGTNITRSKPDPEVFLKAAKMLRISPEEALVVEDAAAGIEAANAGGFASAGLGEAASHPLVTHPLTHFSDLLQLV
ncbi:MAG: beta-phosphoglucomutase [Lachnospiraceae bacterium]|nr:beta-phosphoglucomutase [Lachnospiraceae bacterium]